MTLDDCVGVRILLSSLESIEPKPGIAFVLPLDDREWERVTIGIKPRYM